jgi:surface antigen
MADLSITPANVKVGTDPSIKRNTYVAGESIAAGQPVFSASGTAYLAHAGNATAALAVGVSLHAAGAGQPIQVVERGEFNAGATVVAGQVYTVSNATGLIGPVADRDTGHIVTIVGFANTAHSITIPTDGMITTGTAAGAALG